MKNREPHHFCGVLILLLALVSLYAWFSYPPAKNRKPLPLAVDYAVESPREDSDNPKPAEKHLAVSRMKVIP